MALKIFTKIVFSFLFVTYAYAQVVPTTSQEVMDAYRLRKKLSTSSLLGNYPSRSIGPVVQGGRVVDFAVLENDPKVFYVAYASGGIFKTENNGITFTPVFDQVDAMTIGDIALAPSDENILYVGTGEKNSSRSSYAGSGVYKTVDGGKSWKHLGLEGIHHTSRIVVHPSDPNTVWVASIGALYTHGPDRGVYKSTDGGTTWSKTLFVNDSTGIIDLVVNPNNPKQLWAASWERTRKAWDFKGSGKGSGIFRSDDGGNSWKRIAKKFTQSKSTGRIGLDVCRSKTNVLYALLDSQKETKEEKKQSEDGGIAMKDLIKMNKTEFLALDDEKLKTFLEKEGYPKKYTPEIVKKDVRAGKYTLQDLTEYFGDANKALFNTKITGAELYRSDDFGDSWKKVNANPLEGVYYTYGYYFGEVRVDPVDDDIVYIFGVPLLKSKDGGKTFARIDTIGNVHVDHQALWIDPKDQDHILLGNDGGLYQSYDGGAYWLHVNNVSVGQFYTINLDMEKPYNVYGGLQDNGTLVGSSKSVPNKTKKWSRIFGGDGMFVAPDPRNSNVVYTGFQFGNYYRKDLATDKAVKITPQHDIGEPRLRFNWRTPVVLSPHNADIVYLGAQKLFRSFDQGEEWEVISPDLTKNLPQGNVPYSTITTIAESPMKFGLLYVGTDDGNIQVSRDGGSSWKLVAEGLPQGLWVSSIHPSSHEEGKVYASLNGYRQDHFNTYIFVSNDYGQNWQSLKSNLPETVVNIIYEDPVNSSLLYLGTDQGTYISLDQGQEWHLFNGIPNVATYDMKVHPRENELVIGTHGRSIYIVDVKPLQLLKDPSVGIQVFPVADIKYSSRWGESRYAYEKPTIPKCKVPFYVAKTESNLITVEVFDDEDKLVANDRLKAAVGMQYYVWNLQSMKSESKKNKKNESGKKTNYITKGKYKIRLTNGSYTGETFLEVK